MDGNMKYKVEYHFAYGWDDAGWEDDDQPARFNTVPEAQTAIDELIADIQDAVARGNMIDLETKDNYRVVAEDNAN